MLRIAIVEDEEEYIKQLQKYVRRFSEENGQEIEVSVFRDGNEIVANYSPNRSPTTPSSCAFREL